MLQMTEIRVRPQHAAGQYTVPQPADARKGVSRQQSGTSEAPEKWHLGEEWRFSQGIAGSARDIRCSALWADAATCLQASFPKEGLLESPQG